MKYVGWILPLLLLGAAIPALASDSYTTLPPGAAASSPTTMPGLVTYPEAHQPSRAREPWYEAEESLHTFQYVDIPFRLGLGVNETASQGANDGSIAFSLRYQISPAPETKADTPSWHLGSLPVSLSLEAGGFVSPQATTLKNEYRNANNNTLSTTHYAIATNMPYAVHFALFDELPHGDQTWIAPEIGVGAALASLHVRQDVEGPGVPGAGIEPETDSTVLAPWLGLGVRLFPTHYYSLSLSASPFNYTDNVTVQNQNFNTSLSGWSYQAMLQIRLVWPSRVHVPLTPKRLPPWLIPAYTTEEISPWVASPEVAKDPRWNKPGEPFGNVMFQFQSKYVNKVELVGDFNDWEPEAMIKDRAGYWVAVKDLPPGRHLYNYILNGKREIKDPWNKLVDPNSRSRGSSIVIVPR